jgi:hypothetical protein
MTKKLGQPQKYGEKTKILSIRVPQSKYLHYKNVFENFISVEEKSNCNKDVTK